MPTVHPFSAARLFFAFMLVLTPALKTYAETTGSLTVTGQAQLQVAPDQANVTFGVEERADTPEEAYQQAAQATERIFAVIEEQGYDASSLQTRQLRLDVERDYSREANPITGFVARNALTLTTNRLDDIGPLLSALIAAGVNDVQGLSFSLNDRQAAEDAALEAAVADATYQADIVANAAGAVRGAVADIQIGQAQMQMPQRPVAEMRMMAADAGAAPDMEIAVGEITLSAQVTIRFNISQSSD